MVFQARLFGMAVLWGSGLMLAYDCLRMLRMMIRQRKGIQAAEEAVFWLLAAGWSFWVAVPFYKRCSTQLYCMRNGDRHGALQMAAVIHGCSLDAGGIASDKTNSSNF